MAENPPLKSLAWHRAVRESLEPLSDPCPPAETLAAFGAGRLDPASHAAVETHLARCAACVDQLLVPVVPEQPVSEASMRRILAEAGVGRTRAQTQGQTQGQGASSWMPSWLEQWVQQWLPQSMSDWLGDGGWPRLLGSGLAVAVVVLLVVRPGLLPLSGPGSSGGDDGMGGLSGYELSLSGQLKSVRGEGDNPSAGAEPPRFGPDSQLVLKLTPGAVGGTGELGAGTSGQPLQVYLRQSQSLQDPGWLRVSAPVTQDVDPQTGLIELKGEARAWVESIGLSSVNLPPEGEVFELRVVRVAPGREAPERLPSTGPAPSEAAGEGASGLQVRFRYLPLP